MACGGMQPARDCPPEGPAGSLPGPGNAGESQAPCDFDGEPGLMPKTSQKNRRKRKGFSTTKNDLFSEKRISERDSNRLSPVQRTSKRLQQKKNFENASPVRRMTRRQAAMISNTSCKTATIELARGRIPVVEINNQERFSLELNMGGEAAQKTEKAALANESSLDSEYRVETLQPLAKASLPVVPDTPETQIIKEGRSACKLKIANIAIVNTAATETPSSRPEELLERQQEKSQDSETKLQNLNESAQTPRAPKANRQSVRRSLMGRTSMNKASHVQKTSLASRRERTVQKAVNRTTSRRSTAREQSSTCRRVSCRVSLEKLVVEEIIESRPPLDPASRSHQEVSDQPFSRSHKVPRAAATEEQQDGKSKENSSEKNAEVQEPPQSVRRKASYKKATNELYDGQHTEDEHSPPRKKSLSPQCLARKVVRTFGRTVHKNQVLMMTHGSVSQNSTIKSFLKHNTHLRTHSQEKERQRLENLKKREEAEQQRKQKVEEEKRRRLEEMKRKREEHICKALQARERVEQRQEAKRKLLEQKQHNEKVREEKMVEEKVKKAAAAKKAEELRARKQRALQLEQRRQQELKKKEEQEKARQAAERELEKKREQEKLQAQQERERKEKEKAARLQRELMAAKEKEWLQKVAEEKRKKKLKSTNPGHRPPVL